MSPVGGVKRDIRLHLVLGRNHSLPRPQWRVGVGKSIGKTVREVKRETGRPAPHIEQLESDLWWSIDPTACAPLLRCPSQGSWPSGPSSAASWLQELVADREGSQGTENRGGGWEIGCELGPLPSPFHDRCNLSLTYPPHLGGCTSPWHPPALIHISILESREPITFFSHPKMPPQTLFPTCGLLDVLTV